MKSTLEPTNESCVFTITMQGLQSDLPFVGLFWKKAVIEGALSGIIMIPIDLDRSALQSLWPLGEINIKILEVNPLFRLLQCGYLTEATA